MDIFYLGITFLQGILTFLSPCMLPILPIYIGYMMSAGTRSAALKHAIFIILGFTTIFLTLGGLAGAIGSILNTYHIIFRLVSGLLLIGLGIFMLTTFKHKHCHHHHQPIVAATIARSYVMGIMLALSGEPCIVTFVSSALVTAGNISNPFGGTIILAMYSLGLGLPFLIGSLFTDGLSKIWDKLHKYEKLGKIISAVILISIGIIFATDPLWHDHSHTGDDIPWYNKIISMYTHDHTHEDEHDHAHDHDHDHDGDVHDHTHDGDVHDHDHAHEEPQHH